MSSSPLLSLCVPTYNRAALLDQSLRAILAQITPEHVPLLEVVVLDNASPDDTPGVVQRAQADFPHVPLRTVRRPENIGCDGNFCDAPNQTRGRFLYLLSDDDILLPGAVEMLLQLIQAHPELDAFSLNVRGFIHSPEEQDMPPVYKMRQDRLLPSRDEALALLNVHVIFISCLAFRRENVLGNDYANRYDSNMAQSYMFLDALAPGRGVYATAQPYLAQRTDRAEGYNFFRVWVTNFSALMDYARGLGYSSEAIEEVRHKNLLLIRHFLLIFKMRGHYDQLKPDYRDAWERVRRTYGSNRLAQTQILPLLLLPQGLVRGLHGLYKGAKAALRKSPYRVQ